MIAADIKRQTEVEIQHQISTLENLIGEIDRQTRDLANDRRAALQEISTLRDKLFMNEMSY